jgi:hypothetical protein
MACILAYATAAQEKRRFPPDVGKRAEASNIRSGAPAAFVKAIVAIDLSQKQTNKHDGRQESAGGNKLRI